MDRNRFKYSLDEFPRGFNDLKKLTEELRLTLFPIRGGAIFTGTFSDSDTLYKQMLDAFDKAIVKLKAKPNEASMLISPISV